MEISKKIKITYHLSLNLFNSVHVLPDFLHFSVHRSLFVRSAKLNSGGAYQFPIDFIVLRTKRKIRIRYLLGSRYCQPALEDTSEKI